MIIITSPHQNDQFLDRWLRGGIDSERHPVWVPMEMSFEEMGRRTGVSIPFGPSASIGETAFNFNPSVVQTTGRPTFNDCRVNHVYNVPIPTPVLDEHDPKKKNKIARKKREATKASQNARGRKWWEHR